jgi:hypothetical protein
MCSNPFPFLKRKHLLACIAAVACLSHGPATGALIPDTELAALKADLADVGACR